MRNAVLLRPATVAGSAAMLAIVVGGIDDGAKPAVLPERGLSAFRIIQVAGHDITAPDADFALPALIAPMMADLLQKEYRPIAF